MGKLYFFIPQNSPTIPNLKVLLIETEKSQWIKTSKQSYTITEIEQFFEENNYPYKGEMTSGSNQDHNVIFWSGWSSEAFQLLVELKREKKITPEPASLLLYLMYGKYMTLPLAVNPPKSGYKTPHWLPCVFCAADN